MYTNLLEFVLDNKNFSQKIIEVEKETKTAAFYDKFELENAVYSFSERLKNMGVKDGDIISIIANNSIGSIVAFLAINFIGGVINVIPIKNGYNDTVKLLSSISPSLVVSTLNYKYIHKLQDEKEFNVVTYDDCLMKNTKTVLKKDGCNKIWKKDDIMVVLFSSGTTGTPKGVQLTINCYTNNAIAIGSHIMLSSNDTYLAVLPFSFIAGQITSVLAPLHFGANLVISDTQNSEYIFEIIEKYSITKTNLVPTILFRGLDYLRKNNYYFYNLKFILSGGANCNKKIIQEYKEHNVKIIEGYGSSETGCGNCINSLLEPVEGSVGRPLRGTQIKIVDEDDYSKELPKNTKGIIVIYSDSIMYGYFKKLPLKQRNSFFTTDIGYLNNDGYLFIVGRTDHIIKKGGEKVYLDTIEDVLNSNKIVKLSVVTKVSDPVYGEVPIAFIILNSSEKKQIELFYNWVDDNFSPISKPIIKILDEFPLTYNGKIDIKKLRDSVSYN